MGGLGSGRYSLNRKETTSDYLRLDVRWLQRAGDLVPGRSNTLEWSQNGKPCDTITVICEFNSILLSYNHRRWADPWKHEEYRVNIDWTPCHYGGRRPWFLCPAAGCARRVAVLYGPGIFACRQCRHLTYETQRKSAYSRAIWRAQVYARNLEAPRTCSSRFRENRKGCISAHIGGCS